MDRVGFEPTTSAQTTVVKIKVQSFSKAVVGIVNGLRTKSGNVVNIISNNLITF
jgi:hypothetical protein